MLTRRLALATLALILGLPVAFAASSGSKVRTLRGSLGDPDGDTMIGVGRKFYEVTGPLRMPLFTVANDSLMKGEFRTVTLHGTLGKSQWGTDQVEADWVEARATKNLVVRVYSSSSSAVSVTFSISKGDRFRISELGHGYYHVAPMTGSLDTYAYVKASSGVEIGEVKALKP